MKTRFTTLLQKAQKGGYAVGAFNINNLEILEAVLAAARTLSSPVIISTSEGALEYAGLLYLRAMAEVAENIEKVPVDFHLDHGKSVEVAKLAIKHGYTSVMYDGSALPYEQNVRNTKEVVRYARTRGVGVEAELGALRGVEDTVHVTKASYTDPDQAREFVQETGCDALAVAVGTSHGAYKFSGKQQLDFTRLAAIQKRVRVPLVLHGASGVPQDLVVRASTLGVKLAGAQGIPDAQIKKAISLGVAKVNTDTDLRLAFTVGVLQYLRDHTNVIDPREYLNEAKERMTKVVAHRIKLFGSVNKANIK